MKYGGMSMDYKEEITKMVEKIEDEEILNYISIIIRDIIEEKGGVANERD